MIPEDEKCGRLFWLNKLNYRFLETKGSGKNTGPRKTKKIKDSRYSARRISWLIKAVQFT